MSLHRKLAENVDSSGALRNATNEMFNEFLMPKWRSPGAKDASITCKNCNHARKSHVPGASVISCLEDSCRCRGFAKDTAIDQ